MTLKVSDRLLCEIASGFFTECRNADPDIASALPSSSLLGSLHKHSTTRHENKAAEIFQREGLSCPVQPTWVNIGLGKSHPVLRISDMLQTFADHDKLDVLWGGEDAAREQALRKFWARFQVHQGSHEVFAEHFHRLQCVLPLQLHADEGQTLKKSGIMVLTWQSPIGTGVATQKGAVDLALNYLGSSYKTRYLISVLLKRAYAKKLHKNLDNLLEIVSEELRDLFYNGIELKIGGRQQRFFIACVGLKGDWPIQHKLGHLTRHFARKLSIRSKGICHLCEAGKNNISITDYSADAQWRDSYLKVPPFDTPGPLARIPQSCHLELMFRYDPFHTFHKGCFAELAASALVVFSVDGDILPNISAVVVVVVVVIHSSPELYL